MEIVAKSPPLWVIDESGHRPHHIDEDSLRAIFRIGMLQPTTAAIAIHKFAITQLKLLPRLRIDATTHARKQ
jgi:hypothetical protein